MRKIHLTTFALATCLLAGCYDFSGGQKLEACWSDGTKQTVAKLAKDIAVEHVVGLVKKDTGQAPTPEKKSDIASRTEITLSNLHVTGRNKDADLLTCGGTAQLKFTRPDQKKLTGDTSFEYTISRGESGLVYAVMRAPLIQMVNASTVD